MNKLKQAQQLLRETKALIDELQQAKPIGPYTEVPVTFKTNKELAIAMLEGRTFTFARLKFEYMWTDSSGFILVHDGNSTPMDLGDFCYDDPDLLEICVR